MDLTEIVCDIDAIPPSDRLAEPAVAAKVLVSLSLLSPLLVDVRLRATVSIGDGDRVRVLFTWVGPGAPVDGTVVLGAKVVVIGTFVVGGLAVGSGGSSRAFAFGKHRAPLVRTTVLLQTQGMPHVKKGDAGCCVSGMKQSDTLLHIVHGEVDVPLVGKPNVSETSPWYRLHRVKKVPAKTDDGKPNQGVASGIAVQLLSRKDTILPVPWKNPAPQ